MRTRIGAIVALSALGTGWLIAAAPAAADPYDYPWCIQGREEGYPGYCGFQTYQQCMATASGRDAACGYNPRLAFGPQPVRPRRVR